VPVLQVAHFDLVFPGGIALRLGSSVCLRQGRIRRGGKFSIVFLAFMRRLAHQAFQISTGDTTSNGIGLRGFSGVAAASDHSNALPYHDPDIHSRWTADRFSVDKFRSNRLETEVGGSLRDTWQRRADLLDPGYLLSANQQVR
jgi:hypothetical protein